MHFRHCMVMGRGGTGRPVPYKQVSFCRGLRHCMEMGRVWDPPVRVWEDPFSSSHSRGVPGSTTEPGLQFFYGTRTTLGSL